MTGIVGGLAAIFDGDKGEVLSAVLIVLLVVGVILLILNLSMKPRAPPTPQWQPVPDDTPDAAPSPATPARKAPARRKA